MIAAACSFRVQPIQSVDDFIDHCKKILETCKERGVSLAVFPENFTLELLGIHEGYRPDDVAKLIDPKVLDPVADHARSLGIAWIAGTTFVPAHGGMENVSRVFWPDGTEDRQPKVVLTQYEIHEWGIVPGSGIARLHDPRFGVAVCYDIEFPECGRKLAESGVLAQCVPAYTETEHGFWRVRHCCQARAVENQVFVLHASLLGSLGREPLPSACGTSAILAPSVEPFPANGVLAETGWNEEGIAVAELDFDALQWARNHGDVRNWHDRALGTW